MENKFKLLVAELRRRLTQGDFVATSTFPSETVLAKRYRMSRATVRRALAELVGEGILRRRQGAGTRVTMRGKNMSGKIGLLFPDSNCVDVFPLMTHAILCGGGRYGYSFLMPEIGGETSEMRGEGALTAVGSLIDQRVEGVIFRPIISEKCSHVNKAVLARFSAAQIPVVLIDGGVPGCDGYDVISVDNLAAGRLIGEYLVACGRRRMAFLLNSLPIGPTANLRDRMCGVAGAVVSAGLSWTPNSLIPCPDYDVPALRRYFRRCRGNRPDAIVCGSDNVAISLINSLTELGYSVPEDIAVVGFDDAPYAAVSKPGITTVRQPFAEMAESALERLVQRIRNPEIRVCSLHLPVELVVRGSTGSRKRRSSVR